MINIDIKILPHAKGLPLPFYATDLSAGMDLCAAIPSYDITIAPKDWKAIPIGIAIAIPSGYEAQVRSRSGLAYKNGIFVLNSPGTIDADYRGEIQVIVANFGTEEFIVKHGMRIAQMIINKYQNISWAISENLDETKRNQDGFGSTGV